MAGHLAAPADDDGVELAVHVLPGSQGLQLPGLLTAGPGSHDPCSPWSPGSPVHSRREHRGPLLHDLLEAGMLEVVLQSPSVVKMMLAGGAVAAANTAAHSWHDWDCWGQRKLPEVLLSSVLFCSVASITLYHSLALSSTLDYHTSHLACSALSEERLHNVVISDIRYIY